MPRLINHAGVVVSVSDETAAQLGCDWRDAEPAEDEAAEPAEDEASEPKRRRSANTRS